MEKWFLKTHGDPLQTVIQMAKLIWQKAGLVGMLTPMPQDEGVEPVFLSDPDELEKMNPFTPLMTSNAAGIIVPLIKEHPEETFGAFLKPCEIRALNELVKRGALNLDRVITICVDCLGTYSVEDYPWRMERKGDAQSLSKDALQFARQGGILSYRFRSACQQCVSPVAEDGDINIGVLGLPIREHLLITVGDATIVDRLGIGDILEKAKPELLAERERVITKVLERNQATRQHILDGLADLLPTDVETLITHFEHCEGCQSCLEACPICSVYFPRRGDDGLFSRQDIEHWLLSCAGCGMCEQACHNHLPLSTIFHRIQQKLLAALREPPVE